MSSHLLKKNLSLYLSTEKSPNLQFTKRSQINKGLSGRVIRVTLNSEVTKFEVSDYVNVSKKLRSNVVEIQEKDILDYNFVGIVIKVFKDQFKLNTSYLLRNVSDMVPYELISPLYSPFIDHIGILFFFKKLKYISHSKHYYLRKKPLPFSEIVYNFVTTIDGFADEIITFDLAFFLPENDRYCELDLL